MGTKPSGALKMMQLTADSPLWCMLFNYFQVNLRYGTRNGSKVLLKEFEILVWSFIYLLSLRYFQVRS